MRIIRSLRSQSPSARMPWYPEFKDVPTAAEVLDTYACYRRLTKETLERPIAEAEMQDLQGAERRQVKYWRPTSIGQGIFNC